MTKQGGLARNSVEEEELPMNISRETLQPVTPCFSEDPLDSEMSSDGERELYEQYRNSEEYIPPMWV